jgi:hypothetical protein
MSSRAAALPWLGPDCGWLACYFITMAASVLAAGCRECWRRPLGGWASGSEVVESQVGVGVSNGAIVDAKPNYHIVCVPDLVHWWMPEYISSPLGS